MDRREPTAAAPAARTIRWPIPAVALTGLAVFSLGLLAIKIVVPIVLGRDRRFEVNVGHRGIPGQLR